MPPAPQRIAVVGCGGSGKSTMARRLVAGESVVIDGNDGGTFPIRFARADAEVVRLRRRRDAERLLERWAIASAA